MLTCTNDIIPYYTTLQCALTTITNGGWLTVSALVSDPVDLTIITMCKKGTF